ncbi:MAG: RNA polymerase sigma factor [Deltaproteobacteria bacterium]|nr:RNA polymerase sigma factor [Deltaproteobacteria bacterium]
MTLATRKLPVTELPTSHLEDDAELVRRARSGDRWAEEALYRRHVRSVTNAVTRLLGRTADADDVVQDTFVRALERLAELRDGAAFRGWVQRIAVTLCHHRFRKRKLLRTLGLDRGDDDASLAESAVEGTRPDVIATLRQIDRALEGLSVASRSAWILHRVEGWTLEETAAALEVSLATAKRRLSEADTRIAPFRGEGGAA